MNNFRCFCGHLAKAHSPLKEICIENIEYRREDDGTEFTKIEGGEKVEITSCKWCDKALLNVEVKQALLNTDKWYSINKTSAEETALPPHPLSEEKPEWMWREEQQEWRDEMEDRQALKLMSEILKSNREKRRER